MDVYINAVSEDPYIHTVYLVNYEGTFWWRTRYWIQLYKIVEVYFNYQKRDARLFSDKRVPNFGKVHFSFLEEDLAFLGETMQYSCTDTSRYNKILTWMPRNSAKTKKIVGGCDLWI